ncbi:coiled-coil domain-containing protein 40-like [Bacillus rossius redtenbacheri]|uniref:coiled-coil domain-containing protein 40-like n=1 Tax=Bacillus rossius redtenbacheri TaxID=93214 RepID=UPI002FDEDA21
MNEEELRSELEGLALLLDQFSRWEQQVESDLGVSQRVTEKAAKDKALLAAEKRKQDELMLRLTRELLRLRAGAERLDAQLALKEREAAELGQLAADGGADLSAAREEAGRLAQAWGSVVASLEHRDRALMAVQGQLGKLQERLATLGSEVESYKRSADAEMATGERLTLLAHRRDAEVRELRRQLGAEAGRQGSHEAQLCALADVLSAAEEGLQEALLEQRELARDERAAQQEAEKLASEKLRLQAEVMDRLQQQSAHDKTAQHVNKLVVRLRESTRAQERDMVAAENELSKLSLGAEQQRAGNEARRQALAEARREVGAQEESMRRLEKELAAAQVGVAKRQAAVVALGNRLEAVVARTGTAEKSPAELRIAALAQEVTETARSTDELQHAWLRRQARIVQLTQRAGEQFERTDLLRKQVVVKEQSCARLERDAASLEREERQLARSVRALQHALAGLDEQLWQRRGHKDVLDRDNVSATSEFLAYLKECEGAHAELRAELDELHGDQDRLRAELLGLQRDCLAWEKKLRLATDTKQSIAREHGSRGDVGAMRAEIHRMEVRYSQLRKVQERLAQDLEHCVSRRAIFVSAAQAREKRLQRAAPVARAAFCGKLDDLAARIRRTLADASAAEEEKRAAERRQQQLLQQLTAEQQRLDQLRDEAARLEGQLQACWLHKQKNLELLVRRQRRLRMLEDVRRGRHKLLCRSEAALGAEQQKQAATRAGLSAVLESLLADFPTLALQFSRILNYLRP